jgi:hypothetical protein
MNLHNRHVAGALWVGLFALASTAGGQDISWVAVGADGPFTLGVPNAVGEPTRISLDAGIAYRVEFEIRVNGWGDAPGEGRGEGPSSFLCTAMHAFPGAPAEVSQIAVGRLGVK